jgi:hypothetical protein
MGKLQAYNQQTECRSGGGAWRAGRGGPCASVKPGSMTACSIVSQPALVTPSTACSGSAIAAVANAQDQRRCHGRNRSHMYESMQP